MASSFGRWKVYVLVSIFAIALSGHAFAAAPVLSNHQSDTSIGSVSTAARTTAYQVTSGAMEVVCVWWGTSQTVTITSITDGQSNSYTNIIGPVNSAAGTAARLQCEYAIASSGGVTLSQTVNFSAATGSFVNLFQFEITGQAASPLDGTPASATQTATTYSATGSQVTTTKATDLLITFYGATGSANPCNGSWTAVENPDPYVCKQATTTTGTYNLTATGAGSANYTVSVFAIKPGGSPYMPPAVY